MTRPPLRTVLIGFGKVAAEYAADPIMAKYYPYATHAQVLRDHPAFSWEAVVDVREDALDRARKRWNIRYVARSAQELHNIYEPEVAIIATPPDDRIRLLEQIPSLRAVLVEKPLGTTIRQSTNFLDYCRRRGILVQVNLWRRADKTFRAFAAGGLEKLLGSPQAVFGVYGNGLLNNGIHMVDFVRMLFGEVVAVRALNNAVIHDTGPIPGDVNIPFSLNMCCGLNISVLPIGFSHYRENGLDIWGEKGRLSILQEGLEILFCGRKPNRAMKGEWEVSSDQPGKLSSTVGTAFYDMYSNLFAAIRAGETLFCDGSAAISSTRVVNAIIASEKKKGRLVNLH
jgi:predicted dehydrogenase